MTKSQTLGGAAAPPAPMSRTPMNRLKINSAMETKTVRMDVKKQPMFLSSGKELLRIGWWGRCVSLSVFIIVEIRNFTELQQKILR